MPAHFSPPSVATLALLATGTALSAGHLPYQVVDLNPATEIDQPSAYAPFQPVQMGGALYFSFDDGVHGDELWKTDGTAAGTALVADICKGSCPSRISHLIAGESALYFRAEDGVYGHELWRSDGTAAGTVLVIDAAPGLRRSSALPLAVLGNSLIFSAPTAGLGIELWVTDGTPAGTQMLRDISPGVSSSSPRACGVVGGKLLLSADDGVHGRELWATDGTLAGTLLVLDILPGTGGSLSCGDTLFTFEIVANDGRLYFAADDGVHGRELWVSDGTAAGTTLVADLEPGPTGSDPISLEPLGSSLLFRSSASSSSEKLWRTDGTAQGTVELVNFSGLSPALSPAVIRSAGNLAFVATTGEPNGTPQLWVSDGTIQGTKLLKTLDIPPGGGTFILERTMAAVGDRLIFTGFDPAHGLEPWVSDGTASGTGRLLDIEPGPAHSFPVEPFFELPFIIDRAAGLGGQLYFRAFRSDLGAEVWRTDGTSAGTSQLSNLNQQRSSFRIEYEFFGLQTRFGALASAGPRLFFSGLPDASGWRLWSTRGDGATELATVEIQQFPGLPKSRPIADGRRLTFRARSTAQPDGVLMVSDGTPQGTGPVVDAATKEAIGSPLEFVRLGSQIFATTGRAPVPLWRIEGSRAHAEAANLSLNDPVSLGALLLFAGSTSNPPCDPVRGECQPRGFNVGDLWRRTEESSFELVVSESAGNFRSTSLLTQAGTRAFFGGCDDAAGCEPWQTDGTKGGTFLIKDVRPGPDSSLTNVEFAADDFAIALGNLFIFAADDGVHGREPWVSDGTEAGTRILSEIHPAGPSDPSKLTTVGDRVYFAAFDPAHGRELWQTDGTPEGTSLVADLWPGPDSSLPQSLAAADGTLFFSAHTPALGREGFRVVAGGQPQLIADLAPGTAPSSPELFTQGPGAVYFVANDGATGFELWALPTDLIFADGFESGTAEAWLVVP